MHQLYRFTISKCTKVPLQIKDIVYLLKGCKALNPRVNINEANLKNIIQKTGEDQDKVQILTKELTGFQIYDITSLKQEGGDDANRSNGKLLEIQGYQQKELYVSTTVASEVISPVSVN